MANSSFYGNNPTPTEYRDIDELIATAEAAAETAQTAGSGAAASAASAAASATSAANSASASATSASQSASYSITATTAKNDAQTAATAAATSATAAANSATASQTSANNALTSATNSAASATSAAGSATSATTSATNAANSATASATSATNSANSATAAATSATNAASSATTATTKASEAATSAANAATSESNAAAYELSANQWATKTSGPVAGSEYSAKWHAQQAATSASNATSSASASASSATSAAAAQVAAESARDQTLAAFDNFDDRYLGAKTTDPTTDNDGNPLVAGTLYFNSTLGYMKVYTGTVWVDAYAAGTSFLAKANNLSDLPSVSTARSNLGLGSAALSATSDFAAAVHTHPISQVTGLQTALDGKAAVVHTHVASDITDSTTAGRALLTGADAAAQRTSLGLGSAALLNTSGIVQQSDTTGSAYLPAGTTAQRPASPAAGYIRYNSTTGKFEGYGSAWGNIGGGAAIGDTPPANPGAGDLWWNSADGRMYVYYTDANSSQWVDLSAGGAGQYLPLTGGDVTGNVTVTGNFGVGITAPSYPLVVNTTATSTSIGANIVTRLQSNGTGRDVTLQFSDNTAHSATISMTGGNLSFGNYGTERMRIDASGRVTLPYQPAFSVTGPYPGNYYSISASAGTGYVINWQGVFTNNGSHYSTSTGRFTAPVAGRYLFVASLTSTGSYTGPELILRKNGSGVGANVIGYGGGYATACGCWILTLAANDYVDTYWQANNIGSAIDLTRMAFSGHLIG